MLTVAARRRESTNSNMVRDTNTAVKTLAASPIASVVAKPRIGPVPNWKRNAAAISDAVKVQPRGPSVERALELQKSFWKFVGIFVLLGMVFYFVAMAVAVFMIPKMAGSMMQNFPNVM